MTLSLFFAVLTFFGGVTIGTWSERRQQRSRRIHQRMVDANDLTKYRERLKR